MADHNLALKEKLAAKAAAPSKASSPEATIYQFLEANKVQIQRALPKHMDADRLARVVFTTIRTNPELLTCTVPSLMGAVMQAAQLGLEPGVLGHCYFVPFRNNKTGKKEVQFIIGYRGMLELTRRSGEIESLSVHEVYANDYLYLQFGLHEDLKHIPWFVRKDKEVTEPGPMTGVYMVAQFKGGGYHIHYMSKEQIDDRRRRSRAANDGPWVTDYIQMAKKTVIRDAWKMLPMSTDIASRVMASDETVKDQIAEDMTQVPDMIDITPAAGQEGSDEGQDDAQPLGRTGGDQAEFTADELPLS